jgi:putative DNA recombination protein
MEVFLIIIVVILGLAVVAGIVMIVNLSRRLNDKQANQSEVNLLKTDLVELNKSLMAMQAQFGENLSNLNQKVGENLTSLNEKVSEKLERNNAQMQTSMTKQLSESAKIVDEVSKRLTKLDETNRRVVDVADELKTLQNVLQNPKQRGVFGEFYLESVLDNVLPPKNFQTQYRFKSGVIADAVIFLDRNKILPIDSKFSLENYNRMIQAEDKTERERLLNLVKQDLKGRIDETSKYILPEEGTMDFAFMFIPSESLYYDLLINNVGNGGSSRDLIEYAFRDKRVIIVSPTSFMAYLQTVLQGLRSLQIEEQAKDIQIRVGKLGDHIRKFDDLMNKMGKSLSTTVNHYNNSYKELNKIDKDVVKISGGQAVIEAETVDRPQLGE